VDHGEGDHLTDLDTVTGARCSAGSTILKNEPALTSFQKKTGRSSFN